MPLFDALWARQTLPRKFLFAGGIVMLAAMLFVGSWVSKRIEEAVVQKSASTVALYMDSFISPLSQELVDSGELSEIARRSLSEIFSGTAVGDRVVSVKIWKKGGLIAYASDEALIGRSFTPSEDLLNAWDGRISAAYEELDDEESQREALLGFPLLEVYSPITEPWTGDVIAVAEFYERADDLEKALIRARSSSWMVVGLSFLVSGLLLYGIVKAGGSTIRRQQEQLKAQLEKSQNMARQNVLLKQRVVAASGRANAQAERALRQLGSELHDGPAQYISLAAMRLDSVLPKSRKGTKDAKDIKRALNTALTEIRALSRGLAVPDLDNLDISSIIARAIEDHDRHTEQEVSVRIETPPIAGLGYTSKLCVFRFVQECLTNCLKHAPNANVEITCQSDTDHLVVAVSDNGPGFDPASALTLREDGGQGLMGLMDRAESIGGAIDIRSSADTGATLILTLPIQEG
ncbi:sensor histidine kinase [Roseovarius aestuarii]|uniref:histidine kinase n=1 Tax=Roseovarius aestuarii TaxID=475083 RepID=A0A1X7BUL9_9RHOB|nr:ATP-binding protein [Roseovarius aestuarii]SMC13264.1 Signal transduction histidine-protein kinase/phosphatase DegS [Roseovarius aestuarii]